MDDHDVPIPSPCEEAGSWEGRRPSDGATFVTLFASMARQLDWVSQGTGNVLGEYEVGRHWFVLWKKEPFLVYPMCSLASLI